MVLNPIVENYRKLSKSEKKVGDFLMENPGFALSKNAVEIAALTHTSPATIGRFSRKIGFKNFVEARMNLIKNVDKPIESIADDMNLFVNQDDDLKRCGSKLLGQIHNVCTSAFNIMDFGQLEKAIDRLKNARTVYLAGVGTSSIVAQSLYIKLNTVGIKVQYALDSHINLTSVLVGDKRDVLIAISYSGTTTIMNKILDAARLKGIFIIAICGNIDSQFAKKANIVLQSPAMEQQARIGAVSSHYSQQFVGDLLLLGYITKAYEKTKLAVSLNNEIRNDLHKE